MGIGHVRPLDGYQVWFQKGEKCAEAENQQRLLVSNFSWRTIKQNLSETG